MVTVVMGRMWNDSTIVSPLWAASYSSITDSTCRDVQKPTPLE